MPHLLHRWESVNTGRGDCELGNRVTGCLIEVQRCLICEKERAKITVIGRRPFFVDPLLIEDLYK